MSTRSFTKFFTSRMGWIGLSMVVCLGLVMAQDKPGAKPAAPKANRYIGAEACKNCHQAQASGDQHGTWMKTHHAKAFATLATDKAKTIAKEKGIEDAQRSDSCMKCHQTAFGVAPELIKKGFDIKAGVQCESCHGPGEQHFKARFAAAAKGGGEEGFGDEKGKVAAYQAIPAGEIIVKPEQATCLGCHNDQSPSFVPFCYYERVDQIRHDDPRKPRVKEEELVCGCKAPCPCVHGCEDGKCAVKAKDKK
ncbi:MAG TPA: cytochrome c family protein [Planctomycetota bacterium]|nr:cytochrome c family protein [Planctomycetota bacterium]